MTRNAHYLILAILVVGILVALALTISNTLLYSLDKDSFPSRFHDNADALKQQSLNSTSDISPQLQDFIDFTGPISLNIRIHNIDQARRDLERFGNSHWSIKNLIIKLDMNESEIQELEQNTALQQEMLDTLLNTSVSLDALQSMEVQYREQNNEDMLTTVRLQGNELRKKVRGMGVRYRNTTAKVVESGRKLGLDTTNTQESQEQVDEIIREIEEPKQSGQLPVDIALTPGEERLSLFIRPDTGRYRDVIEYQGISLTLQGNTTLRADGKPITIYFNNIPIYTAVTDTFGYYVVRIPIERAYAGANIVYARSPTSRSINRTLTVIPVNSTTTLIVSKPDRSGNINCTGSIIANLPVKDASVQLTWDETHILVTKTDSSGRFKKLIQLPPGRHTVIARFTGDDYPIYASESKPVTVDVSIIPGVDMDYRFIALVIIGIGILILFLGITVLYVRRISRRKTHITDLIQRIIQGRMRNKNPPLPGPVPDLWESGPDVHLPDDSQKYENETLISYYARILKEHGLSEASRIAYKQIAQRVASDLRIRRHQALTAREMAKTCKGKPYCGTFARFTSAYERIRYGGQNSVKDQSVFETAMELTDDQTGGEKH
ncbi:carboxypeptidase-like regulatory domain-containing protein [uncultured Methanoregula sp.]|uniref:carboxypeptidase-like regulatory domain-containing protein n=1 Tax=uncultured Methanoregula sp. TaxID=1005933 RepID=UPI002AAA85F2|nr:carboxypeptidase-like regulatory domain-containing protein [uncultured Methanoregula sp.]